LRCGGQLFHYRRGKAGTETRLTALRSVGVGGHISEADAVGEGSAYRNGMLREVAEEVTVGCPYAEQGFGFIYDDSTAVGSVHLGVVHLFELESPTVTPREAALADAGFAPIGELVGDAGEFETWSQFVLKAISN
jgi:predicted NUDIX family phosphoesterase